MQNHSHEFDNLIGRALDDTQLRQSLSLLRFGLSFTRSRAMAELPEFDQLRDQAVAIKNHTLNHLDFYLERLEQQVKAAGGEVCWAVDAAAASQTILDLCRRHGVRNVTKGKSMMTEEIDLNTRLEAAGIQVKETDLGEYVLQLRDEAPSHIVGPAIHLTVDQVADTFHQHHRAHGFEARTTEIPQMMREARTVLRKHFLEADMGITGANFLIAEQGSAMIVTNEGNGDLTAVLPRVHVVVAGIDKVVPTLEDASTLLRLLTRSATGQECAVYTTFFTGAKRSGDTDGPEAFYLVLVDNGRSQMLGSELKEMLRCIRCGACMNHCPVYGEIGGQAYGSVYPGPMGAVLTPALVGLERAHRLPNASTFCGKCEEVCPVRIPLPKLMRHWREQGFERQLEPLSFRFGLSLWSWVARHPPLYRLLTSLSVKLLNRLGRRQGYLRRLPLGRGWLAWRDLPAPQQQTFFASWEAKQNRGRGASDV